MRPAAGGRRSVHSLFMQMRRQLRSLRSTRPYRCVRRVARTTSVRLAAGAVVVSAAALLLVTLAAAKKPHPEPCPDGVFLMDGVVLSDLQGNSTERSLTLEGARASIVGLCGTPVVARVKAKRKFTVVKAAVATCGEYPGKVRLAARISTDGCNTMSGVIRARKHRPRMERFTATRRRVAAAAFTSPARCAGCHPRQYQEWHGSMMAYAAVSPTMNALEAAGNRLTDGAFAADGDSPLFCQRCHAPVSVALGEFPGFADSHGEPSRAFMGEIGSRGLSCDFCHQVAHADLEGSLLGDGIANSAFVLQPGGPKFGPFDDPLPSPMHEAEPSDYLRSSEFCGSCHDVRIPGEDAVTGESFRRLEDAFSEWERGPYATAENPFGRVLSCQDCHMSAYPYAAPGTYFTDYAAVTPGATLRRVSTHYFTGVDVALIDFPGQDEQGLDAHGLPIGQARRREDLLRAACTVDLDVPDTVAPGAVLPVEVAVTNSGAGHNVPTGFSQERQMWIELTVTDAAAGVVYQSGYLLDRAHPETGEHEPDGNLHDEDLENWIGTIDPWTLEADLTIGADHNRRPAENLGLVNFGNEFRRVTAHGSEEVFAPFLANSMDNSHSIPPLATKRARYDVRLPAGVQGPLGVSARLRFRAFPPRFLRTLASARPDLLDEVHVDRNRIVEMAETRGIVSVAAPSAQP